MNSTIRTLVRSARVPFLLLTPTSFLLGFGIAVFEGHNIEGWLATLVLLSALCAHISVNMVNEYHDFKSGLDFITQRTAFSGGSGALPDQPQTSGIVLYTGLFFLGITIACGLYFITLRGLVLLPIGMLGASIILLYSGWINRHPFLCLIAPGVAFGPIMVIGSYFVLTGHISWLVCLISLIPFFLVNNLLLLNQYPDIDADRQVGRRHLPISQGIGFSNIVYGVFLMLAFLVIILSISSNYLPWTSFVSLVMLIPALLALMGAIQHTDNPEKLLPALKHNVLATLCTPSLLAISLLFN